MKVYHLMQKCPVLPNGFQLKQIAQDFKRIARCPKCYCIRSRHAARASLHQNPFFENGSKTKHGKFIPNSTYLRMKLKPNSSKIEPHPKTILENCSRVLSSSKARNHSAAHLMEVKRKQLQFSSKKKTICFLKFIHSWRI